MTHQTSLIGRKFVSYLRVSTDRQGRSGLGLDAQREAVARYLAGFTGGIATPPLRAEFVEIESGKRSDRPQLAAALALCRATGAVLIVAKLDRLSRDVDFLRKCVRDSGDAGILFADLPDLPPGAAGKLMLTVMGSIAEFEAGRISERTKGALAAAKARGVKLGNPRMREKLMAGDANAATLARAARTANAQAYATRTAPFIAAARAAGCKTLLEVATAMMARGIRTPTGKEQWHPSTVSHVERLATQTMPADLRLAA
jgi:DNA invertase Pin-like site-specific DNA recombinase